MDPLFISMTLTVVGDVLIGLAVLNVHKHVIEEKRIDGYVVNVMKRERGIVFLGIFFIIAGYFIKLYIKGYIPV